MFTFKTSLGIDFGPNHLILTLLRKSFGKIRLEDYRTYPFSPERPEETQEAQWINQITAFISQHQVSKERIYVSIPRGKVIVRFIRFPIATKENLRKVLEYEAPKYIPFEKEEVFSDFQILQEEKEWLYLLAIFIRRKELEPYLSLLKKIGLQPCSIQIPSVGALNLFFFHEGDKKSETSVLLDLGGPFWEMNLIEGKYWRESFHLPLPSGKREEEIVHTINRVGISGDSLSDATCFVYGLDAAGPAHRPFLPPPLDRIEVRKGEARPDHIYSSIGLPLKGITKTRIDLNLLPREMRRRARQIGKPLFTMLVFIALILSFTWGWGVYSQYQTTLELLRDEVKKRKPEVEAVERLKKQKGEFSKEISEFEKISAREVSKILILQEITQILPPGVWLWNLKHAGGEVEMSGFADSASELIPLLDKSPLFEKVEFLAPVTKERERRVGAEKERERFKIRMKLEGGWAGP